MYNNYLKYFLPGIILLFTFIKTTRSEEPTPQVVFELKNVSGFAVSPDESYMVIALDFGNRSMLFESHSLGGFWSELEPLDIIHDFDGGNANIGGLSFNYNASVLYFHANFPEAIGGYDIYYSERSSAGWSEPQNIGHPINSLGDEFFPYMNVGDQKIFFSRTNPSEDLRKPRRTPDCKILYCATKDMSGRWGAPVPLHDAINKGCEYSMAVAPDGKSILFSSIDQENHRDGYNIYYAREIFSGTWMLPSLVSSIASEESNILPQYVGNNIYFLRQEEGRSTNEGAIYKMPIEEAFKPANTINTDGYLLNLEDNTPLPIDISVYNPTTLERVGVFKSDSETGKFEILLPDNNNYIVDIRKEGYSFASFQLDYRQDEKVFGPDTIKLFNTAELILSVFDSEIFRPLEAKVWAEVIIDEQHWEKREMVVESDTINYIEKLDANIEIIEPEIASPGTFSFNLPLGKEYIIIADAPGFKPNAFRFSLMGEIIFSEFFRNLSLEPVKRAVDFFIADSETQEGVDAEILITNLNREETIIFSIQDLQDGKITAMLREGDEYEFTVRGAQGYSFHNQTFSTSDDVTQSVDIELVPLREATSLRLNNIYFASNSAELNSESFPELNRVVDLIDDNPQLVIEISAHTDDVGNANYNLLLSERRAQSVVRYLLDNEVPEDRIVAKGYGLHNPIAPNDSDDNRALNRRVEFTVIDIRDLGEN